MSKADELWEKYGYEIHNGRHMTRPNFLAAIAEYGKAVRAEAVKVCKDNVDPDWPNDDVSLAHEIDAAAIEKMELP